MSTTPIGAVASWPVASSDRQARDEAGRFAEALRPGSMGPRLANVFGGEPRSCHVLDAKFEPGVRATVLYAHAGRLVRGDLLTGIDGRVGSGDDLPAVVAPGVRLRAFPDDPDLPGLKSLMDPTQAAWLLGSTRCRTQLLRYRPGERATVLAALGAGASAQVAKAYHDPAKAAAVAAEAPGLAAIPTPTTALRLAPTSAHFPGLAVVVQQAVRGRPLDLLITHARGCAGDAQAGVRLAARALAELHTGPAVSRRERLVERELLRFLVRAERVGRMDRRLGAAFAELAHRLMDTLVDLPPGRIGLVHGDCKPSQFLLAGSRVYLLDLDHCGFADQAGDVGTFLATLRQLATRHALARRSAACATEFGELGEVFLRAYAQSSGHGDALRASVLWHQAAALERKALRAFARAPRSPLSNALVQQAHRCLDELRQAT